MSTSKSAAMAEVNGCRRSRTRLEAEDDVLLERLLLFAFLLVATASVGWHLATGVHWMWTSCANHLHAAVQQVGGSF